MDAKKIPTTPVESSNIAEIGYDAIEKTLVIVFHNGRKYGYECVPEYLYQDLKEARSIGEFFAHHIKENFTTFRI